MNEYLEKIEKHIRVSCKGGLTMEEASFYTGIGRQNLETILFENSIPCNKIGSKTIVAKYYLDEILKSGVEI